MAKRYWNIVGYKKFDQIFDVTIPIGCLSDRQLKELLKCLAAKADSSFEDIVGAIRPAKDEARARFSRT